MRFNELGYLKSLDNYSLEELKEKITSLNFSQNIVDEKIYATWSNKYTLLTVAFNKEGKFIKIEKQSIGVSKFSLFVESVIALFR